MSFCMKCGNQIMSANQQFCPNCGERICTPNNGTENCEKNSYQYGQQSPCQQERQDSFQYRQQTYYGAWQQNPYQYEQQSPYQPGQPYAQNSYQYQTGTSIQYPMKWFKFLIYFSLFFGAIINIIFGLNYLTGGIYFVQSNGVTTANFVYSFFGNGLKTLDMIFGILMVGVGVFSIYTRFRLSNYKINGPLCVYILYGVSPVLTLFYNIGVGAITGISGVVSVGSFASIVVACVLIFANYRYFTKRKGFFVN